MGGDGWIALGTEGGHTSFSPRDEREIVVLRHAWQQHAHVSFERLLSGPGLSLMHQALAADAGQAGAALSAPEITRRALDGLFFMIGEEEKQIRRDPVGTGSALLKKVFGG